MEFVVYVINDVCVRVCELAAMSFCTASDLNCHFVHTECPCTLACTMVF